MFHEIITFFDCRTLRPKILHVDSDVEAQGAVRAALAERFEVVSSSGKSQEFRLQLTCGIRIEWGQGGGDGSIDTHTHTT